MFRFSWDWTLSPTKLNHFYAGGNNWRQNHDPPQATVVSGIDWKDKVCLGNVPDCSQNLLNFDLQRRRPFQLGRPRQQRLGKHDLLLQRRLHLGEGRAHV